MRKRDLKFAEVSDDRNVELTEEGNVDSVKPKRLMKETKGRGRKEGADRKGLLYLGGRVPAKDGSLKISVEIR